MQGHSKAPEIRQYWPEEPVLLLEVVFMLRKEPVKIMEEHTVENGALRMSRPVDSCHGKDRNSRNEPKA
jgi:hypothetical protein